MRPPLVEPGAAEALEPHRAYLRAVLYRLTGDAAEAEDLVQETFARALLRPDLGEAGPLRPWLLRVAVNLGIDALRARRRRRYLGTWLPWPVEEATLEAATPAGRYDLAESATLAFLFALEALTPRQRAVLLLRDVLDLSVAEAAQALELSEANVKVTLHRARAALAAYDRSRVVPSPALRAQAQALLAQLLQRAQAGDVAGVLGLLSDDVTAVADGAGRYAASREPLRGSRPVARLFLSLAGRLRPAALQLGESNGLPALWLRLSDPPGKISPCSVLQVVPGPDGRIAQIFSIVAPEKLRALPFFSS